jgi:hypothetical protein
MALDSYRRWVKLQLESYAGQIAQAEALIATQRERVALAQRNFKLLEKLKDRARRKWRKEADAELENLASEAFLAKWRVDEF